MWIVAEMSKSGKETEFVLELKQIIRRMESRLLEAAFNEEARDKIKREICNV